MLDADVLRLSVTVPHLNCLSHAPPNKFRPFVSGELPSTFLIHSFFAVFGLVSRSGSFWLVHSFVPLVGVAIEGMLPSVHVIAAERTPTTTIGAYFRD